MKAGPWSRRSVRLPCEGTRRGVELLAFVFGQSLVIGLERFGPFEPHESRSASSSSTPSTRVMRPVATAVVTDAMPIWASRSGVGKISPRRGLRPLGTVVGIVDRR